MTIYGGFKYTLDQYRIMRDVTSSTEDQARAAKWLQSNHVAVVPEWALALDWSSGAQVIPSPYQELTFYEYILLGPCGHESEGLRFYDGLNMPGETQWLGGLSCHVQFYHTYGLVMTHIYTSNLGDVDLELGRGTVVRKDKYGSYVIRYFRIGCDHRWIGVSEESHMCYHVSKCSKCGMKRAIDSSD